MAVGLWMIIGSLFGVACAIQAIRRNRSAIPWWFAGVAIGPAALIWLRVAGHRQGPKAIL
jgi:hypothetical protein